MKQLLTLALCIAATACSADSPDEARADAARAYVDRAASGRSADAACDPRVERAISTLDADADFCGYAEENFSPPCSDQNFTYGLALMGEAQRLREDDTRPLYGNPWLWSCLRRDPVENSLTAACMDSYRLAGELEDCRCAAEGTIAEIGSDNARILAAHEIGDRATLNGEYPEFNDHANFPENTEKVVIWRKEHYRRWQACQKE